MKAPSRNMMIGYDFTDLTMWETIAEEGVDKSRAILDGRVCPICHKPMMSNEYVVCASLPSNWSHEYDILMHSHCLSDKMQEFLEAVRYSLCEDLGEAME